MDIASQAIEAFASFVTSQPTLEEIAAYHAPESLADHVYMLVAAEKAGTISPEECQELDTYEAIEHILICAKAEALRKMQLRAS
jgi:hypothetical protein